MRFTCRPSRVVGNGTACVFWPGMTQDIHNICDTCAYCNRNAPSQTATYATLQLRLRRCSLPCCPPTRSRRPFEKNFADYFDYAGRHFLIVGDRLSCQSDMFGKPGGSTITGANALLRLLRSYFVTFGVPEKISSNGGPEFTAFVIQDFSASGTSNTAFLPPTSPNPTAARKLQSKPPKDFSCPILALMRI